jgi:hypothetical protein
MGSQVDITTAARALGTSESAVRKRLQRGSLAGGKDADGRWYVVLDGLDTGTPPASQQDDSGTPAEASAVVAALQQTIALLTDQLHEKDEQLRRLLEAEAEQRRIVAGLMARLPELPERVDSGIPASSPVQDNGVTPSHDVSPSAPAPGRPWWAFWRWGAVRAD